MPRLYRPHIPLEVRCRVALRQLGELWINDVIDDHKSMFGRRFGLLLENKLAELAVLLNCTVKDLRLDHDPPLAARPLMHKRRTGTIVFKPEANDPDHLIYREKHAHHIKTNVKGDGAQYPDRVLIKRARRSRTKSKKVTRFIFPANKSKPKMKPRPLRSANRWPAKGSRKIQNRRK